MFWKYFLLAHNFISVSYLSLKGRLQFFSCSQRSKQRIGEWGYMYSSSSGLFCFFVSIKFPLEFWKAVCQVNMGFLAKHVTLQNWKNFLTLNLLVLVVIFMFSKLKLVLWDPTSFSLVMIRTWSRKPTSARCSACLLTPLPRLNSLELVTYPLLPNALCYQMYGSIKEDKHTAPFHSEHYC